MKQQIVVLILFLNLPLWSMNCDKQNFNNNEQLFIILMNGITKCTNPEKITTLKERMYSIDSLNDHPDQNYYLKTYQMNNLPLEIARHYEELNNKKKAAEWYKKKINTVLGLEKVFELEPGAPEIDFKGIYALANKNFHEGRFKKAYEYYIKAQEKNIIEASRVLQLFTVQCLYCGQLMPESPSCTTCKKKFNKDIYFCSPECKSNNLAQAQTKMAHPKEEAEVNITNINEMD